VEMWAALRTRPHLHRLDYDDDYDEDGAALLHQLTGLIRLSSSPFQLTTVHHGSVRSSEAADTKSVSTAGT
jgi:hypothetical protein